MEKNSAPRLPLCDRVEIQVAAVERIAKVEVIVKKALRRVSVGVDKKVRCVGSSCHGLGGMAVRRCVRRCPAR